MANMLSQFTLALAQLNPTVGDLAGNAVKMIDFARQSAAQGADLVLYPEMCLTGYPPEDLVLIPGFRLAAMQAAHEVAVATADLPCDLIFGSLWHDGTHTYNASLLASRGVLTLLRGKHDLPNYGVFDEKRVFDVGAAPRMIEWRGVKLGILICEEVWDVEQAKTLGAQGAELLLVQNASPYHIGKASQRKQVVTAAAAATGLPVVYLNLVGGQDELVFDGRSYAVSPDGADVARLPAFVEALGITVWAREIPSPSGGGLGWGLPRFYDYPLKTSIERARKLRQSMTDAEKLLWGILRKEQLGVKFRKQHPVDRYIADFACLEPKLIIELDGGQHTLEKDATRTQFLQAKGFRVLRFWNHEVLENTEGVVETIFQQLEKSRVDSPPPNLPPEGGGTSERVTCAHKTIWQCTAAPMNNLASDEQTIYQALVLGLRDYVAKNQFPSVVLGLSGGIDSGVTAAIAADALGADKVHTIRLPSPFTSDDSIEDAEQLAAALRLRLDTIPITPLMDTARQTLAPLFQGRHADTTEENIQARLRGLLLMAISNKFGAMVLTTGNKSEMSVGYATLYGDMCGGFSVLKDVYKTTVVRLAHWRAAAPAETLQSLGFLGAASEASSPRRRRLEEGAINLDLALSNAPPPSLPREGGGISERVVSSVIPERMITKPPTAELRPNQRDDDSLPPYEVLDVILRGLIERQCSIAELVMEGMDAAVVNRVARMVANAEYKRRQSAPGVKITPMAFGRDRRWPITNRWKFA
jgi:NAD+ synthetase